MFCYCFYNSMAAKTQKIEKNEEFTKAWYEETALWNVYSTDIKTEMQNSRSLTIFWKKLEMTGSHVFSSSY